jgi:hypothetical protein
MRVTVSHKKTVDQMKQTVDRGFDEIFKGLPIGAIQILNEQRAWNASTMNFSFTAQAGFLSVPLKGSVLVEAETVTIDVDLPPFLNQFIAEEKLKTSIEGRVKGLLT